MWLRSIGGLAAVFIAALLSAVVITGFAMDSASRAAIQTVVDRRLAIASEVLAGPAFPARADEVKRRMIEHGKARNTADLGMLLEDRDGRSLGGNIVLSPKPPMGFSSLDARAGIVGVSEGRALRRDIGGGLILTVVAESEPIDNYSAARRRIYLVGLGSIVAILLIGTVLFSLALVHRIAQMRRTVRAIMRGDLSERLPAVNERGEFRRLATEFNLMLDRVTGLMTAMKSVSSDIAHDLRAPLARLRAQLVRLERSAEAGPTQEAAEIALAMADELLGMFGAVLRIAEIDAGERLAAFERLDLTALAAEVAEMMEPIARDGDRSLLWSAGGAAHVYGDRQLLTQALLNLIENALHHTPVGTTVRVAVDTFEGQVSLSVADNGPGVAEDDRATALRRFGRLDASRNTPGHGLGLALVEAVARLHEGELRLSDARPGLKVEIRLPRGVAV